MADNIVLLNEQGHAKARIIQEIVSGKEITIAHIIANPDDELFVELGLSHIDKKDAIGIVTVCPGETAIIAGDIAMKTSGVRLGKMDHTTGTLIIVGTVSEVEASLKALTEYAKDRLGFSVCEVTRT